PAPGRERPGAGSKSKRGGQLNPVIDASTRGVVAERLIRVGQLAGVRAELLERHRDLLLPLRVAVAEEQVRTVLVDVVVEDVIEFGKEGRRGAGAVGARLGGAGVDAKLTQVDDVRGSGDGCQRLGFRDAVDGIARVVAIGEPSPVALVVWRISAVVA